MHNNMALTPQQATPAVSCQRCHIKQKYGLQHGWWQSADSSELSVLPTTMWWQVCIMEYNILELNRTIKKVSRHLKAISKATTQYIVILLLAVVSLENILYYELTKILKNPKKWKMQNAKKCLICVVTDHWTWGEFECRSEYVHGGNV